MRHSKSYEGHIFSEFMIEEILDTQNKQLS